MKAQQQTGAAQQQNYDSAGNIIQYISSSYRYNAEGQMISGAGTTGVGSSNWYKSDQVTVTTETVAGLPDKARNRGGRGI